MKRCICFLLFCLVLNANAQENLAYQKPSKEILDLVDVPIAPSVLLDKSKTYLVLLYRDAYKTIEELSQEELRLGGLRIDPKTNISSRVTYFNNIEIKNIRQKEARPKSVNGLPANPRFANLTWSPDQTKIALTHTTSQGVELWTINLENATATKLTNARINASMGSVINWFADSKSLLVNMLSEERKPLIDTKNAIPTGPTISVNDGKKHRTEPTRTC